LFAEKLKLHRLSFDMMVRKTTEQSSHIVRLVDSSQRMERTIEGLVAQIGHLSLQNHALRLGQNRAPGQNNNNANGQQQQQPIHNQPPPPGDQDDDDDPPLPPGDDDDDYGFNGGAPPPPPAPLPQIPRNYDYVPPRRGRRQGTIRRTAATTRAHNNAFALAFALPRNDDDANGGDGGGGNGPAPPVVPPPHGNPAPRRNFQNPPQQQQQQQRIQQQPAPRVEDMLRNDYVPDIPMGLPVSMTELVGEWDRKDLGQFIGQTRHWQKKHKTMFGKWHYY
jgi:hypothetical protein